MGAFSFQRGLILIKKEIRIDEAAGKKRQRQSLKSKLS
jgi:hypothetical protein